MQSSANSLTSSHEPSLYKQKENKTKILIINYINMFSNQNQNQTQTLAITKTQHKLKQIKICNPKPNLMKLNQIF
jgi:hypothetical protein